MNIKSFKPQNLILGLSLLFTFTFLGYGQQNQRDTSKSLVGFIKKGKLSFHSRTYLMSTLNEVKGNDFFTLANGNIFSYETPIFHGFQIKTGGFLSFRLAEYNLIDSETGQWTKNRYEKALYDIKHPQSKYNLGGLDEVYLSYLHKGISFKLGRQAYKTPLLNKNFNRLRPNLFHGLSAKYQLQKVSISAAWFASEAVRGTMETYAMSNSFGVYGQGRHPSGLNNDYHGYINTHGTGIFGFQYEEKNWKTQAWNFWSENVFNLSFLQSDYTLKLNSTKLLFGIQGLYQTALNNGGNNDPTHAYMLKNESTFAIGGQFALEFIQQHKISFNYLGISDQGRYLFPREWGREQFYASQTTELFEGYGGLNAYVLRYEYFSKNKQHTSIISGGVIDQPSIDNLRLNKYGLDNYYHFLIEHKYHFEKYMKGLSLRFIATYKKEIGQGVMTAQQKFNKVDMINLNLVIDYKF